MAKIDRNLKGTKKLEEWEGNNKKDGKKVMMELDISSQVEATGRLPLKELNQNSTIRDGEGKGGERNIGSRWKRKERQEKNEIIQGNENNREVRKKLWIQKTVAERRGGGGSSKETRKWKKTKAPEAWKGFQLKRGGGSQP